ncbi:2,3-dihydro-2,3-dihydroxybenzoate dehydrogenase [Pseudomonas sp. GX19020]|uniref:2,3-dihydro-2,3-dihydroxybenzoate dehydrogenase n=1 Tax=Pseudomonas sp. GX19020 TaxID=2942277 RepID=UPI002018EC09|nr:2,3-dihydro-2,3-dihydroxybenzoate dehydrogenase [Pseudomonas sp. GX19020]MCL4069084.1 2,3-dihydro-2,3-dihydroxybenzoate dehydrogenase [Pseudomonas sp. GX19020]
MRLTGFEGALALVTGAGGGIGRAVVQLLLDAGARVVATDLAAPDLPAQPGLSCLSLDVADATAVGRLVAETEALHGPVRFGISVAGVLATGLVTETSDADWRRVFSVNTDGVFHLTRALARVMGPRGEGALVAVSSNAAGVPRYGMAAYAASKAAATMYMRTLGMELAPLGIRCNIVAPGSTRTPMQTGMWADASGEARVIAGIQEQFKPGIPLGKIAEPDDVANAVMFLLSDQAGHVTMADLYVDGGATQQA